MSLTPMANPADLVALLDFPGQQAGERERLAFGPAVRWLVATQASEVRLVLDEAHACAQTGQWCAGWVAYEAAHALNPHLPDQAPTAGTPLALFAVFDQAHAWPRPPLDQPWLSSEWASPLEPAEFTTQVEAIHQLIRAGEVYQINLTAPFQATLRPNDNATPLAYFHALHAGQPTGYGFFMHNQGGPAAGPSHLLSVSPELFFDWDGQHHITTRPMKGTAARGLTAEEDAAAAAHLRTSAKERAENLMIVDLLRNDLSLLAETGSVKVPALFDVEPLPTVWQMTSTITARTRAGTHLSDVFTALFPCGSITGAPKRRAMHHIAQLEARQRGVYCGAIGLIRPGGHCTFNVAIRTVELSPADSGGWHARCGIGSGITIDAQPGAEAQEWWHKQAFLRRAAQPFELLESLRLDSGVMPRRALHQARLARTARHFGFDWCADEVEQALVRCAAAHPEDVHKVRLLLDAHGRIRCEASPLPATPTPIRVQLADRPMPAADEFIRHKTTRRQAYAAFAAPFGCFDTLLWNTSQQLTEFTIGNVAVQLDGRWYTPPLTCGLLPGVMRETLLEQGKLHERIIHLDELRHAQGMALINSVRGWLDIDLAHLQAQLPPFVPTSSS